MREILSWILCTAFTAHTARLLSMASLSLTKARPIQTDRWLYFHAREFRKCPSRFIIWHAVTKPTRPNPRIFAIFKSDACHYIIHARYTVKTDIRSKNENSKPQCVNFNSGEQAFVAPPCEGNAPWLWDAIFTSLAKRPSRYSAGCQSIWNSWSRALSIRLNRHLYLTFPSSKDVIPRTDCPTPRCANRPFPNFRTSDSWSRTYDRLASHDGAAMKRDR